MPRSAPSRCAALHVRPWTALQGIQLFIRVVETGSFSKAAADLGITQPTATKHVAALEQRLGARLLHRSTRGVTPTEIGALYYDKCVRIARELEEADNLAALQQASVRGQLRISTSVAFGRRVMVPLVIALHARAPGAADRPELRGSLREPRGAGRGRGDPHGPAGRFVARARATWA